MELAVAGILLGSLVAVEQSFLRQQSVVDSWHHNPFVMMESVVGSQHQWAVAGIHRLGLHVGSLKQKQTAGIFCVKLRFLRNLGLQHAFPP